MKKIIPIITLLFLISSCSVSKIGSELKTLNTKEFTVSYPNNWVRFGSYGYYYFTPKVLRKENPEVELNNISLNKNILLIEESEDIETEITKHGNTLRLHEKSKNGKLFKMDKDSKYIYKIESLIEYNRFDGKYKSVECFYLSNNELIYISFQMREDLFDKYINEAMIIINSFKPKK